MSTLENLRTAVAAVEQEIQALQVKKAQLEGELKQAEKAHTQEALSRILAEIKTLNIDPTDLVKPLGLSQTKKASGTKNPPKVGEPKYRSSIDPNLTWTGKGRKPAWINVFLENGGNLEDWLIK